MCIKSMKYGARYRYVYRNNNNQHVDTFEIEMNDCPKWHCFLLTGATCKKLLMKPTIFIQVS